MIRRRIVLLGPTIAWTCSSLCAQDAAAPRSVMIDMLENAGAVGYVIVLLSVVSLALIIEDFVTLRREKLVPPDVAGELETLFDEGNYQRALEVCEGRPNYLTGVVAAGLGKLGHPYETVQTALREAEEAESIKLFQKIGWLALVNVTAPMLGLFGTVTGMFWTFGEIASKGGSVSPANLAFGIKSALVTTIFGLSVAIPVGLCFFLLKNRVVRITMEANLIAEELFERFRGRKAG
jgi:biopolymer transport protein ExbB